MLLTVSLATVVVEAQLPAARQVADLADDQAFSYFGNPPALFTELGDVYYFVADDGVHGYELWRTDGTARGTWMVEDLCPGFCSGTRRTGELVAWNGNLYFPADDGITGEELWRSDGTAQGTDLFKEINTDGDGSPQWLQPAGSQLFFSARDPLHGWALWSSDGTAAGTSLLTDIFPGAGNYLSISQLRAVGDLLLFVAEDGVHGLELWKSDGTVAGTTMVRDIHPGGESSIQAASAGPYLLDRSYAFGELLLFSADDGIHGSELWRSDGTEAGTSLVADLTPGPDESSPRFFRSFGTEVIFNARDDFSRFRLWRTDGTGVGTVRISDRVAAPAPLRQLDDLFLFAGCEEVSGCELWRTGGTDPDTERVLDLLPGAGDGLYFPQPATTAVVDGALLFAAIDESAGWELWRSDGTAPGTYLVEDLNPGPGHAFSIFSYSTMEATSRGALFFAFDDEHGWKPRISDGTPGGTRLLTGLAPQTSSVPSTFLLAEQRSELTPAGARLFLRARDNDTGTELYVTDGTAAGTQLVRDLQSGPDGSVLSEIAWAGSRLLFSATGPGQDDPEVWVSDGTAAGTLPLSELVPGQSFTNPHELTAFEGFVYFNSDRGLWYSDGTADGTFQLSSGSSAGFAVAGGSLFYGHLLKIDQPGQPPVQLYPFPSNAQPAGFTTTGGPVYFVADDGVHGRELWRTDGTPSGTQLVVDLRPGPDGSIDDSVGSELSQRLAAAGAMLYFAADDGVHGRELWRTDGTPEGTERVADLAPGADSSHPQWLTGVGDDLFFVAETPTLGHELWLASGELAEPVLLRDIRPGPKGSRPSQLLAYRDQLLFAATDGVAGVELWTSDGSPSGTYRLQDINPGPGASSPAQLVLGDERLWFTATDGVHGYELWSIEVGGLLFADGFESGDLDHWSGAAPALQP